MTPLIQASSIISQFILSLCSVTIQMGNELFEVMMHFHWDKIWPRLNVKVGNKTFSWFFATCVVVTSMNRHSFEMVFREMKPRKISNLQSCVNASDKKMSSLGIEIDLLGKAKISEICRHQQKYSFRYETKSATCNGFDSEYCKISLKN